MQKPLDVAIRAARTSGVLLRKLYRNFDRRSAQTKKHAELVTDADKRAEGIILSAIKRAFPTHSILSEESGGNLSDGYHWIVDPIDGTSNFVMHIPLYGISIALAKGPQVIMGVLYFPELRELYYAEKGKGAYRNGKRIKVSGIKKFTMGMHTICHGHSKGEVHKALKLLRWYLQHDIRLRHFGSAAYELAQVASGRIDTHTSLGLHSWDIAAGTLIVTEAGGLVTDRTGKKWHIGVRDAISSNGVIHKELLKHVSRA